MNTRTTLNHKTIRVYLLMVMAIVINLVFAPASRAGLTGLYTNDFYTMHLWHLQDTNGTIQYDATNGIYEYDYATNVLAAQLLMSNAPGYNAFGSPANYTYPNNAVVPTNNFYSLAGQPGPGAGLQFQIIGTNFGYNLSIMTTQYSCFYAPWQFIGNNDYPDPSYANTNNSCDSFCNTNTGAFTWEALVCPNFNPLTYTVDKNPEVLCMDGPNNSGPGVVPYTERAVQFRFDNATPSAGSAELEFNGGISDVSPIHDFVGVLPTTGPDAVAQGTWYHVAAAYTGTAPTNGDPANVFTLYFTKFDPTRTNADVLTNIHYAFTITNTATHTASSLPYPSNSIIGTAIFGIGGSGRNFPGQTGGAGGWDGWISEVRISDYYRHSNEFMFNSKVVPSKPLVTGPTTNNFVGYGQALNLSVQVAGSQPYAYQWYQNGVGALAGQTNSSLSYSNISYAFNTNTYYIIVTNGYGSATSVVANVTVGATFEGFFNTGCGPLYNPLDQTAPGSIDPHWTIPQNPDNNSLNAIVWGDGNPLLSGGGVVPGNGASVWVGPHENSGKVAGTYSFQTTFQVDETAVTTNTVISGTVGACSASTPGPLQFFLNGVETDLPLFGNTAETVYQFNLTNGLQPGSNTLVCIAAQTASGNSGNVGFNLAVASDTGIALTTAPAITNQPVGVTNVYGSTVSFQAVALGAPPLSYYWLSNGVAVSQPVWVYTAVPYLSFGATNFGPSQVVGTNYTANYQVVFSNFVGSVTSSIATLDVQIPPLTVASAGVPIWDPNNNETNIVVYFSGPVDPVTAATAGNYSLNNGASVLSATLGGAPNEVILTTTVLNPATTYTLTIQNVNSSFGITMIPSPQTIVVGTFPSNVALWLKASVGTTSDGNGGLNGWSDLSGNGNNMTGPGAAPYDPQLATNGYGYPVVRFTGTNETYMYAGDAATLELTNDMSVFAVVNFATLTGGGEIVGKTGSASLNKPAPYDYYDNGAVTFLRGNGSASGAVASTNPPSVGVPHLLDVVMQGTQVNHRLDENAAGTGTLSTTIADNNQPVYIGTRADTGERLSGDMQELILVGSALSSSDVAAMENYLATEYHMPTGTNSYPVITQQPVASMSINKNSTLTVSAAASGTPGVAYQWYDINNIPQAGQTSPTLAINNDVVNDSYYLVATNVYGTATSSVVAVSLITGLNVSLGPPTITIYTGQPYTYTAQASGNVPFYYQWYKGGTAIANATNASYTAIVTSGSTTYSCTVSNNYNGLTSTNAGPVTLTSIADPTTLYQLTVLSNNPVAYWRLNEGPDNGLGDDGTLANDYAGGHTGSYSNAVLGLAGFGMQDSTDTAAAFGVFNLSVSNSFAGEINNSAEGLSPVSFAQPAGSNGEFSVEAWVCSSNAQPLGAGLVAKGYGNGGEQFDLDVYNGFRFFMRDASGTVHGPGSSTSPTIGAWYHVVGVFDGAGEAVHLYINGVDAADTTNSASGLGVLTTGTTNTLLPQAALVSIGARASSQATTNFDFQFKGNIQDVALYNYALSAVQVAAHYQASGLAVSTMPTNIVFAVTNSVLYLKWPANHIGWQLQAQTNSVRNGISASWANYNPSTGVNQVAIPVNLTNGTVFYRLIYAP